jgi:hypothetical protein
MTTSQELDDPFSAHFQRESLAGAGVRIVLLTRSTAEPAAPMISPLLERINDLGRSVEHRVVQVDELGLAQALRRGLVGASLPLVFVTTATEPLTASHLAPLFAAIDKSDHVIGRRPLGMRTSPMSYIAKFIRRLIFSVPLGDVHSPLRLHRLEKLLAIPLQSDSSFLDTEIFAKATFLGHLIDEVDVPPLRCDSWNERWWIDARRLLRHPELAPHSRPSEKAQGEPESHSGPSDEDK